MAARTYTEAELQAELERRERYRKQLVDEVREALKPELGRMAEEIAAANHVKQELKDELQDLNAAVRASQEHLEQHAQLSFHRLGASLIDETGLLTLSKEEREALPAVLREDVQTRRNRRAYDRRERRRTVLWQLMAVTIGTTGGTAIAIISILNFFAGHRP